MKIALTERANDKQVLVVEDLIFDKPNTKKARELLSKISPDYSKKLILIDGNDHTIIKSFTNIPRVSMNKADSIYAYQVLNTSCLIITESALKKMEEVFTNER